jgi:hypothetical protein
MAGTEFGAAKVVIFNGHQNPENLLWGFIAEQLGRRDVMAPFWRNGARTPGVDEWTKVLGDAAVLILLDELPSYLQMAQGEPVGNSTLGDLTIGALERLFNALPRCPCACVVVTNLKDDVYLDGSGQLRMLIENLTKHYDRNAQAITPVQQNSGEVYEIVRKRLFDALPPAARIDEVAQAYVDTLQKAKRVDTIPTTPEAFIERIRESYPFHPSIRDIVARFAENRGYQKTRALIRLLRLAVRGALAGEGSAFLIGLQHLDFNDQATIEEIRKINPAYANAISHDLADRGNALAERIDALEGTLTASTVAKVLLMSSLSAAETPLRGLTEGELVEALVDPLLEVSEIKAALGSLQGQAWYLFKGVDQRDFFGPTANVTAEITEIAANIADEQVAQTLRDKLEEVFEPRSGSLYSKMFMLPGLDEIELEEERPTLVVLERPADALPQEFVDWWERQDLQNRVLVLTADRNAVTTLKASARRMRAIDKVEERIRAQHGPTSMQMQELQRIKGIDSAGFTSALRETFKTIVFPIKGKLRMVDDFRMEFDKNDYSGEFLACPRSATIRATFDGSDPRAAPAVAAEIASPPGAVKLRVVAELNGQFSQEETAPLIDGASEGAGGGYTPPKVALKPDDPATMTSRFEPSDTAGAFTALDRLAKTPGVRVLGGSIDVNGSRSEDDFVTLRIGREVPMTALDLDGLVKTLVAKLNAQSPTVKLRLDRIAFPSGRELTAFCDATGQDFDRVNWTQD